MRAMMDQSVNKIRDTLKPLRQRWDALESRPRRLMLAGAMLLVAGLIFAYGWLPAARAREALGARLPQLEMQLASMRKQSQEVTALAKQPATALAKTAAADVAALQSVFGADAQIAAAADGFRIVIPSVAYASWWDRTNAALSRYPLVLRTATVTRVPGATAGGSDVAVDMRLGVEARGPASATGSATSPAPSPLSSNQ